MAKAWNHNTYYHPALLRRLPRWCGTVLDIGCGDGTFAHRLTERSTRVVALDPDPAQAKATRQACADCPAVEVIESDFLAADLAPASFDVITALASLHHLPLKPALTRMQALLRPGGRLLVLGVWTDNRTSLDVALNHAAGVTNRLFQWWWGPDRMHAPATMPGMTLADLRREAAQVLPGVSIQRRLLWCYLLSWQKPAGR